mgnify:CR=1 FL=1
MLNYIKSECYRTVRNRNFKILVGVCALLMAALVVVLKLFSATPTFPYANTRFALSNLYMQMNLLLGVTIVVSTFLHDNEEKHHTIKHSAAFGIPRTVIFMGRFLVQALVSILIYLVLVGGFTVLSFGLLQHSNAGELEGVLRVSLGSFTCLLTGLAVSHFFLMFAENQSTAMVSALVVLIMIPSIGNLLGRKVMLVKSLMEFFPLNVISDGGPLVEGEGDIATVIMKSLLIGAVWLVAFLVLGVIRFQKKEIK